MQHHYQAEIEWTGNMGQGTSGYTEYERSHTVRVPNKPDLSCSSDIPFRGDGTKYNPEDMLLISLSTCHMLWYLHLCADAGVIVTSYSDYPNGIMENNVEGIMKFTEVNLNPRIMVKDTSMIALAEQLHDLAHERCFIANSVNFPVKHQVTVLAD